ncbi:hypothetical protein D3C78_879140 [compost metagenome]
MWVTDDPEKAHQLTADRHGTYAHHKVMLKGHQFDLIIVAPEADKLKDDPEAAVEFARVFMTTDDSPLMDWARVLLL